MEKLYLKSGYFNAAHPFHNAAVYNFIVGGRGIGKTFGALKYCLDNGLKFIYMRRTQAQVDLIKSDEFNPLNALKSTLGDGYDYSMKKINKNITGIYQTEYDDNHIAYTSGPVLGYIMALSTVSNVRGFDASDVSVLIYDEFIGEKHEKPIRAEGTAFLNAIETIARNREINGFSPLKVICLSNSNDLACPIFIELKLVSTVEKMISKKQQYYYFPDRSLAIYCLRDAPISRRKAQTSLYKLTGSSDFGKMSLENEFTNDQKALIRSMNIKEYRPLVKVGELCIYIHKSARGYYITDLASGSPPVYDSSEMDLRRFTRDYYYLWLSYLNNNITFESYINQVLFEKYFNIRK